MPRHFTISHKHLTLSQSAEIAFSHTPIRLSNEVKQAIKKNRAFLEQQIADNDKPFYGINTGFGSLYKVKIQDDNLSQLQENLVKSHACGTGEVVPDPIVRLILLLKIKSLSFGYSAIRLEVVQRLVDMYNLDVLPVIYQQGSLGASGDLAPLAHLSLPIIGMGEVNYKGKRLSAKNALKKEGLPVMKLQAKEGLALLNGTQFSLAYAIWVTYFGQKYWHIANQTAALSIDGYNGNLSPFDSKIQKIRPHRGQKETAKAIKKILKGSQIAKNPNKVVQDPYSFRCIPQVHGASFDALQHAVKVLTTEINSVTDNPIVFHDQKAIVSGGNFHAQPIALVVDYLAIALAELGSISERRTYRLISGQRDLPEFLIANPGLSSGLMIPQYTAASIASQNKQYCTPASADSIPSSNEQEDHVSMAANAGTKAYRILQNVKTILAIEWLTASQAVLFRKDLATSPFLLDILASYRKIVKPIKNDRVFSVDIKSTVAFFEHYIEEGRV